MDWKIIGISAIINAVLTIILSWIFAPLFFLGPLIGGFLVSYLSKGFEDYDQMELNDGAVLGAISGIVGGFIIGLLLILGLGDISALEGVIDNLLLRGYVIIQLSIIISLVLGLIGGIIGVVVKK